MWWTCEQTVAVPPPKTNRPDQTTYTPISKMLGHNTFWCANKNAECLPIVIPSFEGAWPLVRSRSRVVRVLPLHVRHVK